MEAGRGRASLGCTLTAGVHRGETHKDWGPGAPQYRRTPQRNAGQGESPSCEML